MLVDDKMKMAHEWAMKAMIDKQKVFLDAEGLAEKAWAYADAMQAEYDKRARIVLANESMNEVLNADLSKPMKLQEVKDWQPDWSQAQHCMEYFAVDACGEGYFYSYEPEMREDCGYWAAYSDELEGTADSCKEHSYTGDWRNSLRRRP